MSEEPLKTSPNLPFFLLSNPLLQLRSFDIPAPIILPPGTDPYSFLNPNPHGDGALESPAPPLLDVDPSAAPRSEIITMTTGLTVSEIAGGAFWESATMVETSGSPASSEEVVKQTLDDIVPKKFEHTQTTVCDVPNATCDSKDAQEHSKDMQKLSVSSTGETETQPIVAVNATLELELDKNKNNLPQNKVLVKSLVVHDEPVLGRCNLTTKAEQPVAEKSVTQKPHDKLQISQLWCELCKICVNRSNFERHISGKKHLKKLKSSEKEAVPSSTMPVENPNPKPTPKNGEVVDPNQVKSLRCDICGISGISCRLDFNRHLVGKKHQKNMKKSKELSTHTLDAKRQTSNAVIRDPEGGKRKADRSSSDEDLFGKRQKLMENERKRNVYVSCKLCNVVFSSIAAFTSHLASHQLKQVNNGFGSR